MEKTLVFGGAFDPPHIEHVNMCKEVMNEFGFTKLVLVPTYNFVHKESSAISFEDRVDLIKVAFKELDFEIDLIEKERGKDNYSANILPILKDKYGDISYLIGGDSLKYLNTWYKPEKVVNVCPIVIVNRDGYDIKENLDSITNSIGGNFIISKYSGKDISSTIIRTKLYLGLKPEEISKEEYELIKSRNLFNDYLSMINQLHGYQTDELFEHSLAVVLRAQDYNSRHHLHQEYKKVFLAALLHDNAKQRKSLDEFEVPEDAKGSPVLHQFLGALKAKRDFGIEDEEILNAIKYHTTAKANMNVLEKLIYTADSTSDDRKYDPIPTIREIAIENFDKGFIEVLKYTYNKVSKNSNGIYPLTLEACDYYLKEYK